MALLGSEQEPYVIEHEGETVALVVEKGWYRLSWENYVTYEVRSPVDNQPLGILTKRASDGFVMWAWKHGKDFHLPRRLGGGWPRVRHYALAMAGIADADDDS